MWTSASFALSRTTFGLSRQARSAFSWPATPGCLNRMISRHLSRVSTTRYPRGVSTENRTRFRATQVTSPPDDCGGRCHRFSVGPAYFFQPQLYHAEQDHVSAAGTGTHTGGTKTVREKCLRTGCLLEMTTGETLDTHLSFLADCKIFGIWSN